MRRREFLALLAAAGAGPLPGCGPRRRPAPDAEPPMATTPDEPLFPISLAQWSLHRMLAAGELTTLEFPALARDRFGIDAVEYVSTFIGEAADDQGWLEELKARAGEVRHLLIMVDGEGAIGDPDERERRRTIDRHRRWLDAARTLGCHSIRVNARSRGRPDRQRDLVADGLRRLVEIAEGAQINVLVENHGGISSNGAWLAGVMRQVDHPRCGTLPDFGNFHLGGGEWYDRYRGVRELMPFARAVSAKSHDFDEAGNEVHTDYRRMLRIVLDAGYRGHVGVEYEGERLSEPEGILATKRLLERVRAELAPALRGAQGPPSPW